MFSPCRPISEAGSRKDGYTQSALPFYDITLVADAPTNFKLIGNGSAAMQLIVYDADGHVFVADGYLDRRYLTINVYRAGRFRVEVRNLGNADLFTLTTDGIGGVHRENCAANRL